MFKYVINEEKRTIAAILFESHLPNPEPSMSVLDETVIKQIINIIKARESSIVYASNNFYDKLFIQPTYVGTATCSEEDEWDVEKGKEIARNRAIEKFKKDVKRKLTIALNDLDYIRNEIEKKLNRE